MSTSVCLSVCLSVCEDISRMACPKFTKFSMAAAWTSEGSKLCTSEFVDDVTFSHNGCSGGMLLPLQRRRCSFLHGLTPLLHGNWLRSALDDGGRQGYRRVLCSRGGGVKSAMHHALIRDMGSGLHSFPLTNFHCLQSS